MMIEGGYFLEIPERECRSFSIFSFRLAVVLAFDSVAVDLNLVHEFQFT
jgi:hypothetical protein